MIPFSLLERLLVAERHRSRLQPDVLDFVPPVAMQIPVSTTDGPFVTTLSSGKFVRTHLRDGYVGQALTLCPISEEPRLLTRLFQDLWTISKKEGWSNRVASIEEASDWMSSSGVVVKTLVVPFASLAEAVGQDLSEEEAAKITLVKGCVAEVQGVQVLSAGQALPVGSAILATSRGLVGHYTRIRDHLGMTLLNADRAVTLVGHDMA